MKNDITPEVVYKFMNDTRAFSWGLKKDFVYFLQYLAEHRIDLNLAIACIKYRSDAEHQRVIWQDAMTREWKQRAVKCPQCGKPMGLLTVNDDPSRMVGDGYQTQWVCNACEYYDMYSKRSLSNWFKKIGFGGGPPQKDHYQD